MKEKLTITIILLLALFLRSYQIDQHPSGINADEAAIGYNAYSLLETGKDEHGKSWPLVFQSFNDFKPPLYFYLTIPFIKLVGVNILAVRLPSLILGTISVYFIYLLSQELFRKKILSLTTAIFLAISPWHLHFSRGAWEVNASTTFLLFGILSFIKAQKKPIYFFLSAISIALSLYTYHSIRVIAPLIAIFLLINFRHELIRIYKINNLTIIVPLIFFLLIITPLVKQMLSEEGTSRFGGVSIFADEGPLWQALAHRREHDNSESFYVRVIHNRYLSYSIRFFQNYLSHFSPKYLFTSGDEIARNKIPEMGQSYPILLPFLFFGIYRLFQIRTKESSLILFWFLISPIAAALTFQSPHALRSQNMVIPLNIILAIGVYSFFSYLNTQRLKIINHFALIIFIILTGYAFFRYLHLYYIHYPKELAFAWQYGFDQVSEFINKNQDKYDHIIISDTYDQPYIIIAFYLKYPPSILQQEIKLTPRDQFGFSTVKNFGKYEFRQINYNEDKNLERTLIVATKENVPREKIIHTINSPLGEPLFKFVENQTQ